MAYVDDMKIELEEVKKALTNIRNGGQSYTINAGTGGTSRTVTQADYNTLNDHRIQLEREIAALEKRCAVRVRPRW